MSEMGEVHGTEPSTCRVFANPGVLVRIELSVKKPHAFGVRSVVNENSLLLHLTYW